VPRIYKKLYVSPYNKAEQATNLCVAYAKAELFSEATCSCKNAIKMARKTKRLSSQLVYAAASKQGSRNNLITVSKHNLAVVETLVADNQESVSGM